MEICIAEAEGEKARAEGEKARAGIARAEAEGILQKKIIEELAKPREKQNLATLRGFIEDLRNFLPNPVVENQIKTIQDIINLRSDRFAQR